MIYLIFTDASTKPNNQISGGGYICICANKYMYSGQMLFREHLIQYAESRTIIKSLEEMRDRGLAKEGDVVVVYTDSLPAYNACKKAQDYLEGRRDTSELERNSKYNVNIKMLIDVLKDFECEVSFQKISGHSINITPNTYVDRLARTSLRYGCI